MPDTREKMIRCFSAVFPELTEAEIVQASADDGNWDSLSAVTLLALVEEEFGVGVDAEGLDGTVSFDLLMARVIEALDATPDPQSAAG